MTANIAQSIMPLEITRKSFALATPDDHAEIARILRENTMEGTITLSLERSPDPENAGRNQWPLLYKTIAGRRPGGGLFGCGSLGVRDCYVNGAVTPVGYLGTLRLDIDARNHPRILPRAYEFLKEVHEQHSMAKMYFTSIMNDNARARKVLEAGLPGLPAYCPLGGFASVLIDAAKGPVPFGQTTEDGREEMIFDICRLLNEEGSKTQFAPVWTPQMLLGHRDWQGPSLEDFCFVIDAGKIVACGAIWDQRAFAQAVIRGMSGLSGLALKMFDWFGGAGAFKTGTILPMGHISHLAVRDNDPVLTHRLVSGLARKAHTKKLRFLVMGLPGNDPRVKQLTDRNRVLESTIYGVHWPSQRSVMEMLDGRPIHPEAALL